MPLTSTGEDVAADCPLGNNSPTSKEEIQLNSQIFYPEEKRKKAKIYPSMHSYDMQTFPRGKLIIINVKIFKKSSELLNYTYKEKDRDATGLHQFFLDLGFIVEQHDNPTTHEIKNLLSAATNDDYSNLHCFACVLLSRFEKGEIWETDVSMNINEVISLFRTKKLAGNPKVFFIEACQKLKYIKSCDSVEGLKDAVLDLPVESDFLFCYSTVKEDYTRNHSGSGLLFMQILVEVFRSHARKMDIM